MSVTKVALLRTWSRMKNSPRCRCQQLKLQHKDKVKLATNLATSEFYYVDGRKYDLYSKDKVKKGTKLINSEELAAYVKIWTGKYSLIP